MIIRKGTILTLINPESTAARFGAKAIVIEDFNSSSNSYVIVKWIKNTELDKKLVRNQRDGGYYIDYFDIYEKTKTSISKFAKFIFKIENEIKNKKI